MFAEYEGVLVFVSHDEAFIRACATEILEVKDGRTINCLGTLKEELQCADSDTLRRYHKLAAKADSIEAFTEMLCSHKASQT